ncbi:hypothetical protein [Phosphitispora fastidiosa]|uniref:hypothetical protein n=1 Tax=Phosphitispora fastidiosa TaxID=2837202 RepID=UPI001E498667|nr:hypothetical protein [Phosphitispora fastidiosa]MBU7007223.1 hypothetical protein [Phosphitispora fastidiosa]
MKQLLILKDYRDMFWVSVENLKDYKSMNVEQISNYFSNRGYKISVLKYSEIDFDEDYQGVYVLYQTSEDIGTFYKDYIEDIILFLQYKGAILLPNLYYFRAHHNKNYMELLRNTFNNDELKSIMSKLYGNGIEAIGDVEEYPVVIKAAEGAGSQNVSLANSPKELKKVLNLLSAVFMVNSFKSVKDFLIYYICRKLIGKVQSPYRNYTFYRKKFVIQNFVPNLTGDYKVLFFGGKYYTLYRKNRENDFRASGGGRLFPVSDEDNLGLLDFASNVVSEIDFPIIGMDVGFDGSRYHLIEFQMIHIGPYALHASDCWYEYNDSHWVRKNGKSNLEEEFSRSIYEFIEKIAQ